MTRVTSRRDSLYVQLLKLLVGAAAAAFLIFWGLDWAGGYIIDNYFYDPGYVERKNRDHAEKLQQYINKNQLRSRDMEAVASWVKEQKVVSVRVYKDGILLFDTEYPDQELWEEGIAMEAYRWEDHYPMIFADGEARVSISGLYAYQFYNYAQTAGMIVSFLLFLLFVVLGIRAKMDYIRKLSNEIEILEGGSLDYGITVEGKDELAALAEGLDSMRISFRDLIRQEAQIVQENQKIVTEMSHDLRTPVTSIMLYTEILKKGRYKDEGELRGYIEKIEQKACRMKQLTDHLFAYSLVTGENEIALESPEVLEVLFYDLFSETCSYLEQKGFRIESKVEWAEQKVQINTEYVTRIMDNITSNIIKYADPQKPVMIRSACEGEMVGFSFENAVSRADERADSTCVGIQSVKSMMAKMSGICVVRQEGDWFKIGFLFPLCGEGPAADPVEG